MVGNILSLTILVVVVSVNSFTLNTQKPVIYQKLFNIYRDGTIISNNMINIAEMDLNEAPSQIGLSLIAFDGTSSADPIVIGSGPTGLLTAIMLARRETESLQKGNRVPKTIRVFDKLSEPPKTNCSIAFSVEGNLFERYYINI